MEPRPDLWEREELVMADGVNRDEYAQGADAALSDVEGDECEEEECDNSGTDATSERQEESSDEVGESELDELDDVEAPDGEDSGAGQSGDDPDSDSSDLTCGLNTAPAEHKTDTGEKSAPQSPVPSAAPAGTSSGEARAGAAPVPGEAMVRRAEPRADGYVGAIEDTRAVAVWRQLSWERVRVGARPPVPAPAPGVELRSQVDGGGRRPGAPREALARLACGSVASDRARARQAQQDQSPAGRAPVAAAPGERSVAGRLGIAGTLKGRQRGAESKESKTGGESKAGGGAEEVRWLARNDKWVPIHVEVHVACAGGGARGDVGRVARVVPPRSEAFVVATVAVEAREVAARLEATWSFGLGDPWAVHSARVRYALPYTGRARHVCQSFGGRFSHSGRLHYSVDFDLPVGHQVRAARAGVVCAVKDSSDEGGASRKFADMANYVHILHPDNTVGCYLHFQKNGVTARLGSVIKRGQVIGFVGMTGFTSRPHVHFHVKLHGNVHKGTGWTTLPFKFKSTESRKGMVLASGGWYVNDNGAARLKCMSRYAASKAKRPLAGKQDGTDSENVVTTVGAQLKTGA